MIGRSEAKGKAAHATGKMEKKRRMLISISSVQGFKVLILKLNLSRLCWHLRSIVTYVNNTISLHYCSKLFYLHVWKWLCVHLLNQETPLPPWLLMFSKGQKTLIVASLRCKRRAAKNMMNTYCRGQIPPAELSSDRNMKQNKKRLLCI